MSKYTQKANKHSFKESYGSDKDQASQNRDIMKKVQEIQKQKQNPQGKKVEANQTARESQNPFLEEEDKEEYQLSQQHYFTASFKNAYGSNCCYYTSNNVQTSFEDGEIGDDDNTMKEEEQEFPLNQQQLYSTTQETSAHKTPKSGPKQINTFSAKLFNSKSSQKFDYDSGAYFEGQFHYNKGQDHSHNSTILQGAAQDSIQEDGNEQQRVKTIQKSLTSFNKQNLSNKNSSLKNPSIEDFVKKTIRNQQSNRSNHSSQKNSPSKQQPKIGNFFSEQIQKIQRLQQKTKSQMDIRQAQQSHRLGQSNNASVSDFETGQILKTTPRFEKTGQLKLRQEFHEEDIQDTLEEQDVDPTYMPQHHDDVSMQLQTNNYHFISEHLKQSTTQSQSQSVMVKPMVHSPSALSLLSNTSGFFNQQKDLYLGTLNNFVDTKISTLHIMIQEKRKLNLLLQDQQMQHRTLLGDIVNQKKQQDLLYQEIELCKQRQSNLRDQNSDLQNQIEAVSEKIIEKSDDYQDTISDLEIQLDKQRKNWVNLEKQEQLTRQRESDIKLQRLKEIEHLKQEMKLYEEDLGYLKEHQDKVTLTEKNRVQFMRSKGCDVLKVIQDDKKVDQKVRDKSVILTQNKSNLKLDLSQQNMTTDNRSTSQCKSTRGATDKRPLNSHLQSYMNSKMTNRQQNISYLTDSSTIINQSPYCGGKNSHIEFNNNVSTDKGEQNYTVSSFRNAANVREKPQTTSNKEFNSGPISKKNQFLTSRHQQQQKHNFKNFKSESKEGTEFGCNLGKSQKNEVKAVYATVNLF